MYTHNSWLRKVCHPNDDYVTKVDSYIICMQTSDALRITKLLLGTINLMLQSMTDLI